jgi:hypothetical protein
MHVTPAEAGVQNWTKLLKISGFQLPPE